MHYAVFLFTLQNNCQRVWRARPACFVLTKFCSTLPDFKEAATKFGEPLGLADFLWGDFIALFCLLSVTKYIAPSNKRTGMQTEKYFSATSMDKENFACFPYQNFDFQRFQGAAGVGPYMSSLTDEQEQRGSSFNYYGSQIFPNQIINEEPSSWFISPEPASSIADAPAVAGQKKRQ